MYNFFVNAADMCDDRYRIGGTDYNHIKNVLRMSVGDTFLVSHNGKSDLCEIEGFDKETVIARIVEKNCQNTELPVEIYLFQGLPKSDKMEFIIQKAVELGVSKIIPVEMKRCVVKIDDKKKASKQARWQAIAESAAKQSKRNVIPEVSQPIPYNEAVKAAGKLDLFMVPYENERGMEATKAALIQLTNCRSLGIIIGPEGGFEESEIEFAKDNGGKLISLGKRILRTETAAITALAMCMLYTETNSMGENI